MRVHSILVTDLSGSLVFGRHFGEEGDDEEQEADERGEGESTSTPSLLTTREGLMSAWESEVVRLSQDLWGPAAHCTQVVSSPDGKLIVFRRVGELLAFVCAEESACELILAQLADSIAGIIVALCEENKANKPNESRILAADMFGKLAVCLDELMPGGMIESMNTATVLSMSKLRQPQAL